MTLAENLRRILDIRGMTQERLAKKAGIAAAQINKYTTGYAEPTLKVFVKIAKALNTSADTLLSLRYTTIDKEYLTDEEVHFLQVCTKALIAEHKKDIATRKKLENKGEQECL